MRQDLQYSDHALWRMQQRNLSCLDIEYVVNHGHHYWCAGALHCFLGRRDIPERDLRNSALRRLEGTTVLLEPKQRRIVITVYRNRSALKDIRRKAKTNLKQSQ